MKKKPFSTAQENAYALGRRARKQLVKQAMRAAKRAQNKDIVEYIDSLIAGDAGTGKSWNIERALMELGVPYVKITGNASIFGLMGNLMLLHARKPEGQRVVVFLDDCDFLLEPKNINILKNMTNTQLRDRVFEYTKKVNPKSFTETQQQYLPQYEKDGDHGLVIPCDEFVFVIASNVKLHDQTMGHDASATVKKQLDHHMAIRTRFRPYDFDLTMEEKWGWLVDVAINDDALHMVENEEQKYELLNWVWHNWYNMKETSVRTIQKMGYDILEDEDDYVDTWEFDYLKNK